MRVLARRRNRRLTAALVGAALLTGMVAVRRSTAQAVTITAVRQIGQSGHAGLYAWGAATMPDGSVLIADYWNYRVQRFSPLGEPLGTLVPRDLNHLAPYGVAVDPVTGDLYFGDVDQNATVDKYDRNGGFLLQFGGKGTGPNRFQYPSRLAVGSDRTVYVTDARDDTVSAHTPTGLELFSHRGQLVPKPRGVGIDAADHLYVADADLRKIQVFDKNLNYLYGFGGGMFAGDLRGVAVDKTHNWVYAVDASGYRVLKFTTAGALLLRFGSRGTGPGQFVDGGRDVTVDGDGNVWVADMPNFRAQKFSPSGEFLAQVPDPAEPPPEGGFNEPRAVGVDGVGNVFVSDTHNWRIQRFDPDGAFSLQWGNRGGDVGEFNYAKGLAVDRVTGAVYVCDSDNGDIKKFTGDGTFMWRSSGFKGPLGADVQPNGPLYVADTQNARVVQVDQATGAKFRVIGSRGSADGQFLYPSGVAVDVDGSIWVTDTTRDVVQHFSSSGAYLGKVGAPGTGDTRLQQGWDVEVLGDYVFVSDASANKIKVWTKGGSFVMAYGGPGTRLGQFRGVKGMAMTPAGRLFVVEHAGERVQELVVTLP